MKDPNASALGKKGGKKRTPAKAQAARQNAAKPPKPGKRVRGRPFKETTLAEVFGKSSTIRIDDVLEGGKIFVPYSRDRLTAALAALQSQGNAAETMLHQLLAGKKQDRRLLKPAHVAMREFKPEVDLIMAYVRSGNTTKTVPELTAADLERLVYMPPGKRSSILDMLREAPGTIKPGVSAAKPLGTPASNPTITTFRNRRVGRR